MVDMSLYDSPGKHSLNYCLSLHILNFDLQGLGPNSLGYSLEPNKICITQYDPY